MRMREMATERDSHKFISGTAVTPVEVAILSIQFPLPCVIMVCVFIYHVRIHQQCWEGEGWENVMQIITDQYNSRIFYL
jgi:hypothetical protein